MKTWVIALLVLITLVAAGGCSSAGLPGSQAFAPGSNASGFGARGTSSLTWGSPVIVDRMKWGGNMEGTSLAIVGGKPAATYVVYSTQRHSYTYTLYYIRAKDSAGYSWGKAKALDSWEGLGFGGKNCYTSLCEVNGAPAVCYTGNDGLLKLCYVRAMDSTGDKWNSPVVVDSEGNSGTAAAMKVVNGNPAIAYIDFENGGKYVRALDANGDSWGSPVQPDTAYHAEFDTLEIVNGRPAICYQRYGAKPPELGFIRATDANGDSWGSPQVIQSGDSDGRYARNQLRVINGHPAIAFSISGFGTAPSVYFIRATDADGTVWPATAVTVSTGNGKEFLGSLDVINGLPSIAFIHTYAAENLRAIEFIQALDSDGSSWESSEIIANTGKATSPALAAVGSGAGVAFYDSEHAMNYVYGQ
jgi:hypothetical protein